MNDTDESSADDLEPEDAEMQQLVSILNEHGRRLVDPTDLREVDRSWHPANSAAEKLWRCVEAARDVNSLLSGIAEMKTDAERTRRLKQLATPTHSLLEAVRELVNDFMSQPDTRTRISDDDRRTIGKLGQMMSNDLGIATGSPIRGVRDKLSAHMDRRVRPHDARQLIVAAPAHHFGARLHQAVYILLYLLTFDVYAWAAGDAPDGCDRLMICEPFGVLLRRDAVGRLALMDIELSRSPRLDVEIACRELVMTSQWMFRPGQARLEWPDDSDPRIVLLEHDGDITAPNASNGSAQ